MGAVGSAPLHAGGLRNQWCAALRLGISEKTLLYVRNSALGGELSSKSSTALYIWAFYGIGVYWLLPLVTKQDGYYDASPPLAASHYKMDTWYQPSYGHLEQYVVIRILPLALSARYRRRILASPWPLRTIGTADRVKVARHSSDYFVGRALATRYQSFLGDLSLLHWSGLIAIHDKLRRAGLH